MAKAESKGPALQTKYLTCEEAASRLGLTAHQFMTAALERHVRLWAQLFERREYWMRDRRSEDPNAGDGCPKEVGEEFFEFIPLFSWHVAALLKHGRVETDVLADDNGFWKQTAGDGTGSHAVEVTRDEPLYVLATDVERILDESSTRDVGVTSTPAVESYFSKQLVALQQAARRFWANADRTDPSTHPINSEVAAWLEEKHGFSQSLAKSAASIVRPEWAPVGRKPGE